MLEEVLRQIDYMMLLRGLNPRDRGLKILVNCPKCGDSDAYCFKDGQAILCRKANKCGNTTTLVEYITGSRGQRGQEWLNAVQQLATAGGVSWQWTPTIEQRKQAEEENARKDALETLRDFVTRNFANQCSGFTSHPAAAYLEARGFRLTDLATYGFGLLDNVQSLRAVLDASSRASLKMGDSKGWNEHWSDRILIPLRDRWGRLVGYAGRSFREGAAKKYLNTGGARITEMVALELHHALQHSDEVIAVEGFLDPFKARQYGIHTVIGIGSTGNAMSPERWERLAEYGVKAVTFLTDNDPAGKKGQAKALENHIKASKKPTVFVMALPEGSAKDLDSWLDDNSTTCAEQFPILYNQRIHCDKWRARMFAENFTIGTEAGNHLYLEHCLNFDSTINDPLHETSLKQHFWPEVAAILDLGTLENIVNDVQSRLKAHKEKERARDLVTKTIQELQRVCHKDPLAAMEKIQAVDFSSSVRASYLSPVRNAEELLLLDHQYLANLSQRALLGVPQYSLPTLDRLSNGLRGLMLIAGQTNIGKTILLCQTALEAVRQSSDVCVLFASLEMPPRTLRIRLLSYLSGMSYDEIRRAHNPLQPPDLRLTKARRELTKLLPRIRFLHPEEPHKFDFTVRNVIGEREDLKAKTGCSQCIVIVDFLGMWPAEGRTDREEEKKQIADMLALRDDSGAVLSVTEVRKRNQGVLTPITEEDVMGSARTIFNADFILICNRFQQSDVGRHFEVLDFHTNVRDTPLKGKVDFDDERYDVFKAWAAEHMLWPLKFDMVKVRDGGQKGSFNALVHWDSNCIKEGLRIAINRQLSEEREEESNPFVD